jgi:hypothetical protein
MTTARTRANPAGHRMERGNMTREMGVTVDREHLITSIDCVWAELQTILRCGSSVKLGPPELLRFEVQQLTVSIHDAKLSHDEHELERCLHNLQRFVSRLRCLEEAL